VTEELNQELSKIDVEPLPTCRTSGSQCSLQRIAVEDFFLPPSFSQSLYMTNAYTAPSMSVSTPLLVTSALLSRSVAYITPKRMTRTSHRSAYLEGGARGPHMAMCKELVAPRYLGGALGDLGLLHRLMYNKPSRSGHPNGS
jgi:hypothetical protein